MNGSYYQNPTFPNNSTTEEESNERVFDLEVTHASITDVLKGNIGKNMKIFCTFSSGNDKKNKVFEGILEGSGIDFVVISNPKTGDWDIIMGKNIDYINSSEKIKL